jgi:hypothetical protein
LDQYFSIWSKRSTSKIPVKNEAFYWYFTCESWSTVLGKKVGKDSIGKKSG